MADRGRYRRLHPWVGVTDFAKSEQTQMMAEHHLVEALHHRVEGRPLMVGVMMSYKTLHDIPTKWADAWVSKKDLSRVFLSYPHTLNTLHYADFDGLTTPDDLIDVVTWGGRNLDAVQFDMVWPEPFLLEFLRKKFPSVFFILQVNAHSLEMVHNNLGEFAVRLSEYDGVLEGVLLDKSMGTGLGLDGKYLRPFVATVVEKFPRLTVGVAGGLGPDTLELLEPLREFFPQLAIDAQGRLRKGGNSLDPIEWHLARQYVSKALAYLGSAGI